MLSDVFEFKKIIHAQIQAALWECCSPSFANQVSDHPVYDDLVKVILEDAIVYSKKDPASRNSIVSILQAYTSFKAVLHYRIASSIYKYVDQVDQEFFLSLISNRGKFLSGAEIHYKSKIGANFVLDHGYGTVIGETSVIGDNCYLLGGIMLGATGIANNLLERRHPQIGNNVEIGAFSRLFGNIEIGNNVFIGPNCVVLESIPDNCRIILKSQNQVMRRFSTC